MSSTFRAGFVPLPAVLLALFLCGADSLEPGRPSIPGSGEEVENKIPESAKKILEQADTFELLSLCPLALQLARAQGLQPRVVKGVFHGYKVLGRTPIKEAETRKKLVGAFERGVEANQGLIAACFNPRHGIRVARQGKKADFVICFECFQVYSSGEGEGHFLISGSPEPVFDQALREAGVRLAPKTSGTSCLEEGSERR